MKFETHRLLIRPPLLEDAKDIFNNYAQDVEVTKYLTWKPHKEFQDTVKWIKKCILDSKTEKSLFFVLSLKEENQTIGMIDFRLDDFKASFGYVLAKKYWNKGFMTEAMKPVLEYVLNKPNIFRIWATHDLDNEASGKVMLKLGMTFEGILRRSVMHPNISNEPRDGKYYSLVK